MNDTGSHKSFPLSGEGRGPVRPAGTLDAEGFYGDIYVLRKLFETPGPTSLLAHSASQIDGWVLVTNPTTVIERNLSAAGWSLFFLAGEIQSSAWSLDPSKAGHAALMRLAERVKAGPYNGFEVTRIRRSRFLGIERVILSAHARHLQTGVLLFG